MTQEEMEKYQQAMFLFCGGRYIRNNRDLPGTPKNPPIDTKSESENNNNEDNSNS